MKKQETDPVKLQRKKWKTDMYSLSQHRDGYVVKVDYKSSKMNHYLDQDGLWLGSKKNMKPMAFDRAEALVQKLQQQAILEWKTWRL